MLEVDDESDARLPRVFPILGVSIIAIVSISWHIYGYGWLEARANEEKERNMMLKAR